jgi:uncharacterized protein involved in cysteine biosynthesis
MAPPEPVEPAMNSPPPDSTPASSVRWAPHKVAASSVATPTAPPEAHADRAVYGFMQPFLGARMLFSDGELLRAALLPAGLLAAFCALVALVDPASPGVGGVLRRFYQTFAVLAPLPTLLLARYYARFAVKARHKLGFATALPCYEPLVRSFKRWVKQSLLVAIGLVPVTLVLKLVPLLGGVTIRLVVAAWALHWIVVDAFDSARTLAPGQTLADLDALAARAPQPWFVRLLDAAGARLPAVGRALSWFARWCDRLAQPFREEVALVEQQPWLMAGFALATAALLATPVLNLLFRPIVLIGAVHVSGRFEHETPSLPPPAA